jgi:hypothetical protein
MVAVGRDDNRGSIVATDGITANVSTSFHGDALLG